MARTYSAVREKGTVNFMVVDSSQNSDHVIGGCFRRKRRSMELLNLQRLAGGALQEKVNEAMGRVLVNMQDPNTPWKKQRSISLKITFAQNEERDDVDVAISVETKLAAVSPITTRMSVGTDLKTGENFAYEYGKQVKGQISLEDYLPEQRGMEENAGTDGENNVTRFARKQA